MAENSTDTRNSTLMPSTAAKTTFLVIFLLVGLFGNLFLIITIGSSRKHRSTVVHIVTLNLAVTNLLDCLVNFSFAIGYTVSSTADLDIYLCRTNAFFMNLVTTEMPLTLLLYSFNRFIYSTFPDKYVSCQNFPRTFLMVLYTWIQSLAFSIPLAAGLVGTDIDKALSVCLLSDNINSAYLTFYTLLCFVLPICAITIFFIFIIKSTFTQRDHIHSMMTRHHYSKDTDSDQIQYLSEVCATKFVGVVCLSWLFCEMPFVGTFIVRMTFSGVNYSSYTTVTLLWLKFSYVMALPLLAFTFNKDIWITFKDRIFCKKRNSVVDATNKNFSPDNTKSCLTDKLNLKIKQGDEKKVIKDENVKETYVRNTTGFQVPVFFATSNGVHIHTLNDDESLSETEDVFGNPKVVQCDVSGSQDYLNQCDTSDYDSGNELDPFSVSHPVTSKSLRDSDETLQRRSNSHPEVRMKSLPDVTKTSVTISSAADSGVDISTSKTITSKSILIPHNEATKLKMSVDTVEHDKGLNIPGEVREPNLLESKNTDKTLIVPCSNNYSSDLDTSFSSDISTVKKKKKRKDKPNKTKISELSHTSNGILDIRPPARLLPLPKSPVRPGNESSFKPKLSLDLLSAQQLCDTSNSVITPSACHLVSNSLVN